MKIDFGDAENALGYVIFMMDMMWNILSLVDLHGLDMCWGWKEVILHRKSFVPNQEEMEMGETEHSWGDAVRC